MTEPSIQDQLSQLEENGLRRSLTSMAATGPVFEMDGRAMINFSSNDYLNLSRHPKVLQRASEALHSWGTGATASRLLAGNLAIHEELEATIAQHKGKESGLLFGSGYLTNCGIISSFLGKDGLLLADKLAHACILDGARFAGAAIQRFRHNDMEHLETLLVKHKDRPTLVATESVFSMNGDTAPLTELVELATAHGARILIDEAHSYGIQGPGGCGRIRELGLQDQVHFSMGTLSKGLGSYGGYVACSAEDRDWMINKARSLIYSTALPPASVGAALGALEVIESEPDRGSRLLEKAAWFRSDLKDNGFEVLDSQTQIIPVRVGDVHQTVAAAEELRDRGIWAFAIRPPTVPPDGSCIRFSLSAGHDEAMCRQAIEALCDVCKDRPHAE